MYWSFSFSISPSNEYSGLISFRIDWFDLFAVQGNLILGISELKWTGKGEFNSDDHYIYYCRQESLRSNEVAIIVNKRIQNAVLGCSLKNNRIISVHFQGKPFNITVIQPIMLKKLKWNGSMKTYKTF